MAKWFVIFNPAARGDKSRRLRQFLDARAGGDIVLCPTSRPGDATRLAADAVRAGADLVVAAGGDGTINEVVNGLGPAGTRLGLLPLGTVNVFARELRIPRAIGAAWQLLNTGRDRLIDLPVAEFGGRRRYFVQLAGVGFDARAVRAASWNLKKKIGPLSYVWAACKTIGFAHPLITVTAGGAVLPSSLTGHSPGTTCHPELARDLWSKSGAGGADKDSSQARNDIVAVEDARSQDRAAPANPPPSGQAVFIGNGRFYGGSFRLFPDARLDDGRLDICILERCRPGRLARFSLGLLRGGHVRLPDVRYFQSTAFTCAAADAVPLELDGEDAGDGPVTFSVLPRALRVVVP